MTKIVAFTGKRGSGKDTAALALKNIGYKHMSFADPLREITNIAYGVSYEEMTDSILKEEPLQRYPYRSPRELLTILGTQAFRDLIDQQTWVKALERRAKEHTHVVISDLRFLNEEKTLKEIGATIIRIVNPNRVDTDDFSQHRSETEMDEIVPHHTIVNDGTIDDLHSKVLTTIGEPPKGTYWLKPAKVDAVQWLKAGDHPAAQFMQSMGGQSYLSNRWAINTPRGWQVLTTGDWIVKSHDNTYAVMSDAVFKDIYEKAS